MFLKIVHKEDDQETRLECRTYEYRTDHTNSNQVIFSLDTGRSQFACDYVFSKELCIIYVESDSGKTVDKFNWKSQDGKFKRM